MPLEAAEILFNNRERIEIDIFDRTRVELIHKLVRDLTPFPEIKENVLSWLDEKEYSSFREIDLINQRSNSRTSKDSLYDKTDSDSGEDRDYSRSFESDLTDDHFLKYVLELESMQGRSIEHQTDIDQTDEDSDPSLSKKRTHRQVTQTFEQLPEVVEIKTELTKRFIKKKIKLKIVPTNVEEFLQEPLCKRVKIHLLICYY